jgi:hypothetical protein
MPRFVCPEQQPPLLKAPERPTLASVFPATQLTAARTITAFGVACFAALLIAQSAYAAPYPIETSRCSRTPALQHREQCVRHAGGPLLPGESDSRSLGSEPRQGSCGWMYTLVKRSVWSAGVELPPLVVQLM